MGKEAFLIYTSFYRPISILSDKQLGRLFRAIFNYNLSEAVDVEDDIRMAFEFFKNQFDIDERKYQTKVMKNTESGRKGGNPNFKKGKSNPYYQKEITEDNLPLSEITEDNPINDNDNDNVNDNNPPISPPKGGQGLNPDEDTLSEREAELNAREQELLKREAALKAKEGAKLPDISFVSDDFKEIFETWLRYKQEKRESYKSKKSLQACYKKLLTLSGNDPDTARNVVDQSMANNWSGLFELTQNNHGTANRSNYTSKQEANAYALERLQQHKLDLEAGLADQVERPF